MSHGRAHARARTARPAPAARRPQVIAGGARGIRWDRLGRGLLLFMLLGILALYVGPAMSFVETYGESRARKAEVRELRSERAKLLERRARLRDPVLLEREARRLGMVRPGERVYVVKGLPGN